MIYIYEAKRSPIGKFKKGFINTDCSMLGMQVAKSIIENTKIDVNKIDKVILGNVLSAGLGQNIARQILINSGIPDDKTAYSINMVCGSGMKAVHDAFNDIKLGNAHCILAGGVENMSMAPLLKDKYDDNKELKDSMLYDALTDVFSNEHMGITAENVAEKYNVTREDQDKFAYDSQHKVQTAIENKKFDDEIVPIKTFEGEVISLDEFPRFNTEMEKLSALKPAFKENGTVTAGNASGINDGCALLLIGDETISLKPKAEIIDFAEAGCDPNYMGMGPLYAISKLLEKNNLNINDIDLFEINEAFASQSIAVIRELSKKYNINLEEFNSKINVNGGAIALGHPVGASGARIITTLVHEMKRRNSKYGVASLCIGGGMGIAVLLKNMCEED